MSKMSRQGKCVHTEHCCVRHGCKYGNDDCPVYLKLKLQSRLCETCYDDGFVYTPNSEGIPGREPMINGVGELSMEQAREIVSTWKYYSDLKPLVGDRLLKEIDLLNKKLEKYEGVKKRGK